VRKPVRAFASSFVVAFAALGVMVSTATAAAPDHSKVSASPATFPAGTVCPFTVTWDVQESNVNNLLVFPVDANGDQVVRITGHDHTVVTNADTGASITLSGGFREDLIFHADGTIDVRINGTILAAYGVPDFGGPSMWWFKGHLHDTADATFTGTGHAFVGNATDLCAALS
jgi:hypothetical protein